MAQTPLPPPPDPDHKPPPPPPPAPQPPKLEIPEERLGIEKSTADTKTWLGQEKPTPHAAEKSVTEQGNQRIAPGVLGAAGDAASKSAGGPDSAGSVRATPESNAAPTPTKPDGAKPDAEKPESQKAEPKSETERPPIDAKRSDAPKPDAARDARPANAPAREQPDPDGKGVKKTEAADKRPEDEISEDVAKPPVVEEKVKPGAPDPLRQGPDAEANNEEAPPVEVAPILVKPMVAPVLGPPAPPPQQPAPKAGAAPGAPVPGLPGDKTERDSDPTSLDQPTVVKPGQPAAAKGLRINTVRPDFSTATQVFSAPKNTTVKIVFGRDGRVRKAEFLEEGGTGSWETNRPVMDAVYRWTARGEAIKKLPPGDPEAGVTIVFKLIFN